jgi:hypothetical protein
MEKVIALSVYKNKRGEIEFAITTPELATGTIPESHFRIWLDGLNRIASGEFENKVFLPEITITLSESE